MGISYVHPSVSSTITDNSTSYVTATGTTKLFAVFTSEKGVDNEIKMITSVSEFVFNYGEPNMKLYGQASYNITNWLNAGGVVYCLRVLPEDAGYANAIVNIQTKVSSKEVLDTDGNPVVVENVELRPCVTYTSVNNSSKSAIEFNELRRSSTSTIDGYSNNMLFAVVPKGRGKGYNDLGFRFTLTDAYDSTYEFRLYNFEVTKKSETGSVSTIQGPFLVSLDPDAMSNSGSSLFITDVIDNYCDYFTIIFNEANYEKLANTINPYVHPNKIDFFNGTSRLVNGEYETYYDDRTKKEEDVHMSVVKYIDKTETGEHNIVDATDTVEASIANVDNTYRKEQYDRYNDSFNRVKEALGVVRKIQTGKGDSTNFTSIALDTLDGYTIGTGVNVLNADNTVDIAYNEYDEAENTLENGISEENYMVANEKMYNLSNAVNTLMNQLYELFDYAKISQGVDTSYATTCTSLLADLQQIESSVKILTVNELVCNKYKNVNSNLSERYNELSINANNAEKEVFIFELIGKLEEISYTLENIANEDSILVDTKLENVKKTLNSLVLDYSALTDEYITADDYKDTMDSVWTVIGELLAIDNLYFTINLALLESKSKVYNDVKQLLVALKSNVISFVNTVVANIGNFSYDAAKMSVSFVENSVAEMEQNSFVTYVQNYDSYISLLNGSDGSIDGVSYNDSEVEKLIIAGYKGMIDGTLTDKDQWPIDMVLDANYSASVKNAIATLCTEIRDDFMGILDTEFQASPADAINYRKNSIGVNSYRLAIFTQDFVVSDAEYTGNAIQVTPTYFLASKIPANDNANGIHWNFVGPRRGTISGYKAISFLPNPEWRERLYNAQVNYVQQDQVSTRFNSQLTSQTSISALSNISCVRTLLRIQRDVEDLMKNYQFEFNDDVTITNAQTALNAYLNQWLSNRACDTITGTVYASDYDRQQKLLRVKIEIVFNSIIERIAIDLIVNA